MNGFTRIKSAFSGIFEDYTPMMLHAFMPAAREYGITMKEYRESAKMIAASHITYARKYGLDGILLDIDTCILADAIGVPVDYPEDMPARTCGHIRGGLDGAIEAMDADKVAANSRVQILAEAVQESKKIASGEIFVRGNCDQMAFSLASLAVGMEDFMMALPDSNCEEKLHQLLQRALEVHLAIQKIIWFAGADCTSFGESMCGPDVISPRMYRNFAKPYHEKLCQELNGLGIPTICHICGRQDKISEDLAEIGFAGIEVDYKTDIQNAQKAYAGKSLTFGPIDPSGIFCLGSPELVTQETKKVLAIYNNKNIVIGAGCALPAETPEINVRAFVDCVKKYKSQ